MGDHYAGKPFLTNHLGQLSLASPRAGGIAKSSTLGWGKGGNVTSAEWQVTLCDPIWHVSSRSGEAFARTAIHDFTFLPRELCSRGICHGRVSVCLSVCLCVCLSQVGFLLKRLNVG